MNTWAILLFVVLMSPPAEVPSVDCFSAGAEAMRVGRADAALAAFQAAFSTPGCRYHRGSLLLNVAAAFDMLAEDTGEARYACAAAVRYLGVVDEPATPTMIEAARRGAASSTALCGRDLRDDDYDEMGLEEVLDNGTAVGLATTLTIGAVGTLAAGGTLLVLAAEAGDAYRDDLTVLGQANDYDQLSARLNRATSNHEKATRLESMGTVLLAVGGVLAVSSIWAWIDLEDSGLAMSVSPRGAALVGAW